jgi:hypothetical protein
VFPQYGPGRPSRQRVQKDEHHQDRQEYNY